MKLLPFESYTIETRCTAAEAAARLSAGVEPLSWVGVRAHGKLFAGAVSESGFRLRPVLGRQTSFSPEIFGRFVPLPTGTRVLVETIPNAAVLTMIGILGGFLGLLVFYRGPKLVVLAAGGVILSWLLGMGGFWLERGASRRSLEALLNCGASVSPARGSRDAGTTNQP